MVEFKACLLWVDSGLFCLSRILSAFGPGAALHRQSTEGTPTLTANQIYPWANSRLRRLDRVDRVVEAGYQIGDVRIRFNARCFVSRVAKFLVLDSDVL